MGVLNPVLEDKVALAVLVIQVEDRLGFASTAALALLSATASLFASTTLLAPFAAALLLLYPLPGHAHLLELALVFVLVEEFVHQLHFLVLIHLHELCTFASFLAPFTSLILSIKVKCRACLFTVKVEVVDVLVAYISVKFTALPFLFFFAATATHWRISESYRVFEIAFLVVVHLHYG